MYTCMQSLWLKITLARTVILKFTKFTESQGERAVSFLFLQFFGGIGRWEEGVIL